MDRRKFLQGVTLQGVTLQGVTLQGVTAASAGGLQAAAAKPAAPKESAAVEWSVHGFTCITCAVGLEVMLRGMPGVTRVKASYPANRVSIGYDAHLIAEKTLRDFIAGCGFQVA